jgi:hypothetical protein
MFDDDPHSFGFAGEWEVSKDLIVLLMTKRIDDFDAIFLSLFHYESNTFNKFYESYLVGTGCLEGSDSFIEDWSYIVAED